MELAVGFAASYLAVRHYRRLRRRLRPARRMDALFGQVRQGLAKAVQLASENAAFQDFPECSILGSVDRVSIKLKDPNV